MAISSGNAGRFLKLGRRYTLDSFSILPFTNACVLLLWHHACHLIRPKEKNNHCPVSFPGLPKARAVLLKSCGGLVIGCAKHHFLGGMSDWRSMLAVLGSNVLTGRRQMRCAGVPFTEWLEWKLGQVLDKKGRVWSSCLKKVKRSFTCLPPGGGQVPGRILGT